jgi:hypothetical protein
MELEITPEPTPQEREAILRALAVLAPPAAEPGPGAWWAEGLREALEGSEPDTPNGHWKS